MEQDSSNNEASSGTSELSAGLGAMLRDGMRFVEAKPNPRPTQSTRYETAWEYVFVLSAGSPKTVNLLREPAKRAGGKAYSHRAVGAEAQKTGGSYAHAETKIRHNVWEVALGAEAIGTHPAPFPFELARDHIATWSLPGDLVCDPFTGSGTTAKAAKELGRRFIGFELSQEYCAIAERRIAQQVLELEAV